MATDLLKELGPRLAAEFEGIAPVEEGLRVGVDARYGAVELCVDHDPEVESLRVSVAVPFPAGAGPDFLLWCLCTNAQYWDVKLGLDDDGRVVVHADLDADVELDALARKVLDRAETIIELLDDDLTAWLLEHGFGTPHQRERWSRDDRPAP